MFLEAAFNEAAKNKLTVKEFEISCKKIFPGIFKNISFDKVVENAIKKNNLKINNESYESFVTNCIYGYYVSLFISELIKPAIRNAIIAELIVLIFTENQDLALKVGIAIGIGTIAIPFLLYGFVKLKNRNR